MPYAVFVKSAEIYRNLRQKGITVRKSVKTRKRGITTGGKNR